MASITSANAVLLLGIDNLYSTPIQLTGFSADDVYALDEMEIAETMMGVDGVLSGGFVFRPVVQNIFLQADSPSNGVFDLWFITQQTIGDVYYAQGSITLNSLGAKYNMVKGILTKYTPAPEAKKLLQPRRYTVTWQRIIPQPSNTAPNN